MTSLELLDINAALSPTTSYLESLSSFNDTILELYSSTLAWILSNLASKSSLATLVFCNSLTTSPFSCSNATYFFLETQELTIIASIIIDIFLIIFNVLDLIHLRRQVNFRC